jgi:hypothetical protein
MPPMVLLLTLNSCFIMGLKVATYNGRSSFSFCNCQHYKFLRSWNCPYVFVLFLLNSEIECLNKGTQFAGCSVKADSTVFC